MPAKHSLHVVLTEPLVRYVRDKVMAGHHATASDVVPASLRQLPEREDIEKLNVSLPEDAFGDVAVTCRTATGNATLLAIGAPTPEAIAFTLRPVHRVHLPRPLPASLDRERVR